jgi:Zn/Cd-binding protein ZinT
MMRATEAYDQASKHSIITEYAQRFHLYHKCDPQAICTTLHGIAGGI